MSLDEGILTALVGLMEEDREAFVPARLSILVYLYFTQSTKFTSLQKRLGLTSGNLSSHLRKLEALGYVRISKYFVELKPTTVVSITQEGAQRVQTQLARMRELVGAAIEEQESVKASTDDATATP